MEGERIKDLNNLLKPALGENVEIVDKTITNLTQPGDNYFSDMLKLQVTTRNKDTNATNTEHFVAKCCIADADMAAQSSSLFKPEIAFYKEIVPTMQKFLKEHGQKEVEIFPKLIAARYNLDGKEEPDGDAVLVLENLQVAGFGNQDRHKGFDLEGAKLLVTDLAVFHAVPLAIKLKQPDLFQKVFVDNCPKNKPKENGPDHRGIPKMPRATLKQILSQDHICRKHVDKLDDLIDADEDNFSKGNLFNKFDIKETVFSGLVHKDMWVNNTMQKKDKDGRIVKNNFVDFQMYGIQDVTTDLIFFLLSSVDIVTLEEHFEYLLQLYHEHVIKTLESLKCDVASFKYVDFINNLKENTIGEFFHILLMNNLIIYIKKGEKTDFDILKNLTVDSMHPIARRKFVFLFKMLVQKEWI
ncbi:uncharacterized protein LOC126888443 [Diabrotica virgifera virgifera]|uniref:CHK kinase-like domain-containing protein n=1 Tax=Diabrotica virgifera virgifera TaxID=50390 RepID=A0ABM5KR53_DIAVI|nr:uncharacterized protein LOC126888443 [Diabrotica virgifera virgifera]